MCDGHGRSLAHWKGWVEVPAPRPSSAAGAWSDISHCLTQELDRVSLIPAPTFRKLTKLPEDNANVTDMHMAVHVGTHVDSPCHFVVDGPAAEDVPLERLYGPGVVWRIDVAPLGEIDVHHLEAATPRIWRGDIVLISTGWARHIGTPLYEDHPALTVPAAEWLVEQGVKVVGVDFSTPDLTVHKRPAGFTWPVHRVLLSRGVLIAEHLTGLEPFENRKVEVMLLGLNIRGSDGMPARAVARLIDD